MKNKFHDITMTDPKIIAQLRSDSKNLDNKVSFRPSS